MSDNTDFPGCAYCDGDEWSNHDKCKPDEPFSVTEDDKKRLEDIKPQLTTVGVSKGTLVGIGKFLLSLIDKQQKIIADRTKDVQKQQERIEELEFQVKEIGIGYGNYVKEIQRLREALDFYAEDHSYRDYAENHLSSTLYKDQGARARAALEGK